MNVLVLDNHFDEGDQSHFFTRQGERWVGLFRPDMTLREFLEDRIEESGVEDAECGRYDVPEGGLEALRGAAETEDYGAFFSMLDRWEIYEGITNFGDWEISYESVDAVHLSPRALGTVLSALRLYQDELLAGNITEAQRDVASNYGTHAPLDDEEIEALCDELN